LAEALVVADDDARAGRDEADGSGRIDHAGIEHGISCELGQVDAVVAEWATLVEPCEQKEVVDETAHPRGLALDAAEGGGEVFRAPDGSALEELGVPPDRRERRAQLVGGVADEPPQALLGGRPLPEGPFDLSQHDVEGTTELTDLGAFIGVLDPFREVAGGDLTGGRGHPLER
jgi:hypothetical protein